MESSEGVGFSINREAMKKSFAVGMNDTEEMENSKGETVEASVERSAEKGTGSIF